MIADSGHPETFAAAVIELLNNPQMATHMGHEAAETVRAKFGWSGVAHRFTEICENTIGDYDKSELTGSVSVKHHELPAA